VERGTRKADWRWNEETAVSCCESAAAAALSPQGRGCGGRRWESPNFEESSAKVSAIQPSTAFAPLRKRRSSGALQERKRRAPSLRRAARQRSYCLIWFVPQPRSRLRAGFVYRGHGAARPRDVVHTPGIVARRGRRERRGRGREFPARSSRFARLNSEVGGG